MWLLISEKGELFHITPQKEHIVGRKDGAIVLSNDQSISRHHATIILKSDDPNEDGNIILVDTSSKYGTYVNDGIDTSERVKEKEEVILKHDDLIRFGLQWNKWRVIFMPVIVLSSTIKQHEKALVKSQIQKLGGKFLSSWSPSCTHLVMNQITLTVKVVSALGAGQHIVMPTYWQKLLDAVESKNGNLPDPANYIPPLNEATLNENQVSFSVNKQRSSLFKSLLFVASSSKQLSRIEPMVTAAGGKVVELSNCGLTKEDMCKDGVILMQSLTDSSTQTQNSQVFPNSLIFAKYILSKGLRCIPESDIGLSVVYCSREKFCNPKYRLVSLFETHPAPMQQTEPSMIIAPETEEHSFARPLGTERVIDETCVNATTTLSGKSVKRPLNEESDEEEKRRTFKKPLTQNTNKKQVPNVLELLKKNCKKEVKNDAASPHSENDNLSCSRKPNKSNKGVIFIEDSDEENSDSNVPKRKDQSKSPEPSNESEKDIFGSSNKNNKTATNNNIPTSVDMFSMEKTVTKSNIPTSVDMFSLGKNTSSPVEQKKQSDDSNSKPLTSTPSIKTSKKSYDMFDVSNISSSSNTKKSSQCNENFINKPNSNISKVGDSDEDDDDFGFKSSKQDSIALVNDNGDDFEFKSNSRKNSNLSIRDDDEDDNDFSFQSTAKQNKNLKQIENNNDNLNFKVGKQNLNKSSAKDHIFQVSSSTNELKRLTTEDISDSNEVKDTKRIKLSEDIFQSSSKSTGLKRRTSGECEDNINNEGSSSKKLPVIIEDSEDYANERFGNDDFIMKEIKEEPDDGLLNGDYHDHGMTVVEVKSLLAPLREISLSKGSNVQQTFNFKKFKKATPLKVPEFIDLVEYMGDVTGTWADEVDSASSDVSDEDDDGWNFQKNKVAKQKKATSRRVKL